MFLKPSDSMEMQMLDFTFHNPTKILSAKTPRDGLPVKFRAAPE